jgi:hypothetical protein
MRLLLILIIILAALAYWWPEQPVPTAEESIIGPQLAPLNKAKNLEQDYLDGIDQKKEEIEDQAGGG